MPDYINPSDVTGMWAEGFSKLGETLSGFSSRLQEADRVSQYSSGLAAMDRAFSTYNRSLKEKRWARPASSDETAGTVAAEDGAGSQLTIGQIEETELAADHEALLRTQRDFIRQNYRNKQAQEQLLQVLEQRGVQNYDQVAQLWGTFKTHDLIAESDRNIKYWSEKTSLTPDERVERIAPLLRSDVERGLRYADDASIYLMKVTAEIQSSWAVGTAVEKAKAAKWDTTVADKWLDANTSFWDLDPAKREAARNTVRSRVEWEQREQARLHDLHDDEADLAIEAKVHESIDSVEGLRKIRDTLPAAQFRLEGRMQRWTDYLTNRINAIEAAATRSGGPDLDKDDDPARMSEYLQLKTAYNQGRPLTSQPQYGHSGMKTLAVGRIPSSDDLQTYLLYNYGQYVDEKGVAQPRIRRSFVESEHDQLGSKVNVQLRAATDIIWKATQPTKEQPIPILNNAQAGDLVAELRDGFANGLYAEADLPDIAARFAARKRIEKAYTESIPLNQRFGGRVLVMDTTEQFLNDVANNWFTEWRGRDDSGELDVLINQHALQMQTRMAEYVGATPTNYAIQRNGEVTFWYEDPANPGDATRGNLYRFAPQVVDEKTAQYADPAPKLEQYDKNTRQWKVLEDQRPYAERNAEAARAAAKAAARTAAEEELLAQTEKDVAELLPLYEQKGILGAWFKRSTGERETNNDITGRLGRARALAGPQEPSETAEPAMPTTTVTTVEDALKLPPEDLLARYEHRRGLFGGWFERSTGLRIMQRSLTDKLDAAEKAAKR